MNVRIYIHEQYIQIFEYSNIFVTLWSNPGRVVVQPHALNRVSMPLLWSLVLWNNWQRYRLGIFNLFLIVQWLEVVTSNPRDPGSITGGRPKRFSDFVLHCWGVHIMRGRHSLGHGFEDLVYCVQCTLVQYNVNCVIHWYRHWCLQATPIDPLNCTNTVWNRKLKWTQYIKSLHCISVTLHNALEIKYTDFHCNSNAASSAL